MILTNNEKFKKFLLNNYIFIKEFYLEWKAFLLYKNNYYLNIVFLTIKYSIGIYKFNLLNYLKYVNIYFLYFINVNWIKYFNFIKSSTILCF